MKICSKCKLEKLESNYYSEKRVKCGLQASCKSCQIKFYKSPKIKLRNKERYERNKEVINKKRHATILDPNNLKWCPQCEEEKPKSCFPQHGTTKDGFYNFCKNCKNAYSRAYYALHREKIRNRCKEEWINNPKIKEQMKLWRQNNPDKIKDYRYKFNYGLTIENIKDMLVFQEFKCKICSKLIDFDSKEVDHDHKTGKIRGLLCHVCNFLLGLVHDNVNHLQNAITYLS
jgi:hypothetical protein